MEHTEDGIDSISCRAGAFSSVDCWSISMLAVADCSDGAGVDGTTDGVDLASVRTELSPSFGSLVMNRADPIGSNGGSDRGGDVTSEDSDPDCIGGIAG